MAPIVKFTATIEDSELKVFFSRTNLKNQDRPAKRFTKYLEEATREQFETETDPSGKPWKKLKPSTLKRKIGDKIGTDIGTMKRSLYARLTRAGRAEIGFKVPYAAYFAVERPLLDVTPEREAKGQEIFEDHYRGQLGK